MATTTTNALIARAQTILQDTASSFGTADAGVRWSSTELLGWLNDGQKEVVLLRPQASVKNIAVALTGGETRQSLPDDGIMLIDVIRNMGAGGATPGDAIRICAREVLDAQRPTWHSDTNTLGKVQHFMYDPRDPKNYYVYPKSPGTWSLQVVYSASPTNAGLGGVIQIDDIYANVLVDYILYRAYSKDAEYALNGQLAVAHYSAFQNSLGVKTSNEMSNNPNLTAQGFNPNVAGSARI